MKKIAMLGLGVVGRGTAELLTENAGVIAASLGEEVRLQYILTRREMPESPYASLLVQSIDPILADPDIVAVAEVLGGLHPAYEYTKACLAAGKSVVSANKELVAAYGAELLALARERGIFYLFEASCGGAIPLISPLVTDLAANEITGISGILNGTTNYILTRMLRAGATFEGALTEAQEKGYAERNPAADIDGLDARRKICILTACVTGILPDEGRVHTEGISGIRPGDVRTAEKNGYTVKLLGRMVRDAEGTFVMTAPFLVPLSSPLAPVEDVRNGALVQCNFAGEILLSGRGAGGRPTASAVAADLLAVLRGDAKRQVWTPGGEDFPTDFTRYRSRHYLALAGVERHTVAELWRQAEFLSRDGEELVLLTPVRSERELGDDLAQLTARGARVQAHLRVCDTI